MNWNLPEVDDLSEQAFYLMHKDDVVAAVTIDSVTGTMLRVSPKTQTGSL